VSIGPAQLVRLVRELVAEEPRRRWEAANSVTDVRTQMDLGEAHGVAYVLAALAVWETPGQSREAQLHALAELHEWEATTAEAVDAVRRIDRASLTGSEVEYVEWLLGG
jgi:hypothetical protein